MARSRFYRLLLASSAAALVIAVVVLLARDRSDPLVSELIAGDADEALSRMDPARMPAEAERFLATNRPWRAARVMRGYAERVRELPIEHRVLAARAEAGWDAWPEVLALLEPVRDLASRNITAVYLLARARDETGDAAGAVQAYRAFLALPAREPDPSDRAAARLRLALALIRTGAAAAGATELASLAPRAGAASMWLTLLAADARAHRGDTAAVREAVAPFESGIPALRGWRARVTAARQAGDIPAARALANQARAWAGTRDTRAEFLVLAARAALDMGDVAAGRDALRAAITENAATPYAREAADILRSGRMNAADHLAVARVFRAQGLNEEALPGYRQWLNSSQGTAAERVAVRMEYANALFYAERYGEVAAALRPIASQIPARLLHARAEAHRDNTEEAVRIYLALARQYPRTGTGAQGLFLAAGTRHDAQDFARARELYQRVVLQYPGTSQMGLAMMRLAGIAFLQENAAGAARLWEQYAARYPRGTHALAATYWAGRARAAMGDSAGAAAHFRSVRQRERDSYYALLASERLGESFWPLPLAAAPAPTPAASRQVASWMQGIDLLRTAGFQYEASAEADRIVAEAGNDRATLYALAEALAERGYAQRAIRLGLRLQGSATPDLRLLRILYPFPYRTLITEEARARGLDPSTVAALIRQESTFEARITSPVGARGLMQIMPATGARLARAVGIDEWDAELLYQPEINVHLGTRYVAQHTENYRGSLPSVFSAYNAGAHRVAWWSKWPEYGNDELFTERIPFAETRDYVRILTRNRAIYRGLYGEETTAALR